MVRRSSELTTTDDDAGMEVPLAAPREVVSIRQTQEELGCARCPLCQARLVARQGRAGPYFDCGCIRQPVKRAS